MPFLAAGTTDTKFLGSTGVATANSTNKYQKYKSVELGDQLSYANMGSAFVLYVHNFNCMGMDSTFQDIARMVMIIDKDDNVVDDGAEDDNDMLV